MKKILFYTGLAALVCCTQIAGILAQPATQNLKVKGKLSPNTENEDNEADPPYKKLVLPESPKKMANAGNQQHVSDLENGLQIVKDIIDKMIEREYSFSLLSQHKYMINNCLGIKVSAGEFSVKFMNPVFEVGNLGKITIKLGVNKINLSALKIRMRPCLKPEHIASSCHFGKKFEIGGEATDVSVTAVIAPVARALAGSAGLCFFALEDNVVFNWKIGGLNLKPMQNNLDQLGKDMLEDGLNAGLFNVFYTQFIKLSKEVIPQYYKECENAYDMKEIVNNLPPEVTGGNLNNNNNADNNNSSGKEAEKWVITPVSTMKGVLGRLDINFPQDIERNILIYQPADKKFITSVSRNDKIYTMAPGQYRFTLTNVPVDNVPIQKGHETRLKAGFLNIVSEGDWHLYNDTKETAYTSGNKPKKLPLPIGNYQLKLGLDFYPVVIKDGETVEF